MIGRMGLMGPMGLLGGCRTGVQRSQGACGGGRWVRGGRTRRSEGMGDRGGNGEWWASRLIVLLVRQSSLAGADG